MPDDGGRGAALRGLLLLDVEAERGTRRLRSVGVVLDGRSWRWDDGGLVALRAGLEEQARGAGALVGHNLAAHDRELLQGALGAGRLFDLPVIDTLVLSPLSHPQNPYHRLIKDYKLAREAVNDPVADAKLAGRALIDEIAAFRAMPPDRLGFYAWCLRHARFDGGISGAGMADLLGALGARPLASAEDAAAVFLSLTEDRICRSAGLWVLADHLSDPARRLALAYVTAWIGVTEHGDSVLPAWVRRQVPQAEAVLRVLRETPCADLACAYCRAHFDAVPILRRTFGFDAFRAEPRAPDGGSLQQKIVEAGLREEPLLAILPTGGGKSLCFQVPALARYARSGALTVVISPLQALMRDQVENLEKKAGTTCAAALYGMLTPPERAAVLEQVRLGSVGILYISPEQLRNKSTRRAILARKIGAWVFDEAHCLSKWGHDFRPDYLYAARFIKEHAEAPVFCFTATAKQDVIDDIRATFRVTLGQSLTLLPGGVKRSNLTWSVHAVEEGDKAQAILDLLARHLDPADEAACAVVYCSTRGRTRDMAETLRRAGWDADFFHAGRSAREKAQVLDAFTQGLIKVVCATNAFGMGIDKDTVRLVAHADIPGSLENYLQEAGRAGRDGLPAHCALLYAEKDVERQFRLSTFSEVQHRDIGQLLRGLRQVGKRLRADRVVVTTGELMGEEGLEFSMDAQETGADTKIKTAIAWLEKAELLRREENDTRVFAGRPRLSSLDEAEKALDKLSLPPRVRACWKAIYAALLRAAGDADEDEESFSTDSLCVLGPVRDLGKTPQEISAEVGRVLHDMEDQGLIEQGTALSAVVKPIGLRQEFDAIAAIERAMLREFQEAEPDGGALHVGVRALTQRLRDQGHDCDPEVPRRLVKVLDQGEYAAGKWVARLRIQTRGRDHWRVHPMGTWSDVIEAVELRQAVSGAVLDQVIEMTRGEGGRMAQASVRFTVPKLAAALKGDMLLAGRVGDWTSAVETALVTLHGWKVITLQQGLAIFRQAMTIDLPADAKGRTFTNKDYAPLAQHYQGRVFQVHVMADYARRGLTDPAAAEAFANDYFALDADAFERRYLKGREVDFRRPLSPELYARIVTGLGNRAQEDIVTAPAEANLLVLAGPGSGKTRVIVHRAAWLIRGLRQPARSLLVLCYNRSAAQLLRQRLRALIGDDAAHVDVFTYHGLAMRLIGASFAGGADQTPEALEDRLKTVIPAATALLEGEATLPGLDPDDVRDRLLARYRTILIDEYQDIDAEQYALVSAIAGREREDADEKIALMAVGDDDQSIYAFRAANVEYIRRFEADYKARRHYLTENYRSTRAIVIAANGLIAFNRDRMKTDHAIRVDKARAKAPLGGRWQALDPLAQGLVQRLDVVDGRAQAVAVVQELRRLRTLAPDAPWSAFAVLSPTRRELVRVRALCESEGIPVAALSDGRERGVTLSRLREVGWLLEALRGADGDVDVDAVSRTLAERFVDAPRHWFHLLDSLVEDLAAHLPASGRLPVSLAREVVWDALTQMRRDPPAGDGLRLATLHGAKGQEFPHVLLLDADRPVKDVEEDRRLFYVGMTRAEQTLTLLARDDTPHRRVAELADHLTPRRPELPAAPPAVDRQVATIGLGDLFIDWAGQQASSAPVHGALAGISAGDRLHLHWPERGNGELRTESGQPVACLSKDADRAWRPRAGRIDRVTVLAMVRREATDSGEDYRDRLRVPLWEVPVVEVWWRE